MGTLRWLFIHSADTWNKLFQDTAIVVGGIAAYYRWFKGRPYRGRLELAISGTVTEVDDYFHIHAIVSIKNIGLTKLEIKQDYTILRYECCKSIVGATETTSAIWEKLGSSSVFVRARPKDVEYIEGGEMLQDQKMIIVPKREVDAFQIELQVGAGTNRWVSRVIITPERKTTMPRKRITL